MYVHSYVHMAVATVHSYVISFIAELNLHHKTYKMLTIHINSVTELCAIMNMQKLLWL